MVYGDNRPYNVALVVAERPGGAEVGRRASTCGLPTRRRRALEGRARARALQGRRSRSTAAAFKGFESIRDFALIADDFTTDNGMLTPSLKLKRRKVVETYGPLIDQLYSKEKSARPAPAGARLT